MYRTGAEDHRAGTRHGNNLVPDQETKRESMKIMSSVKGRQCGVESGGKGGVQETSPGQ